MDEKSEQPGGGPLPGGATEYLRAREGLRADLSLPSHDLSEEEIAGADTRGRYAVLGEIARGGMGAIIKIVDNDLRRPVAMKVILGHEDRDRVERFVEEAQVTGQLEHPNIVPVHELGLDEEGKVYFTMKLVRGDSLDSILDGLADKDGDRAERYPLSHLLQIYLKVCDAVAFAHSKGVVHRDLKPENVMVGVFGEVLVMDWGLSKVHGKPDQPDGASRQTDLPDQEKVRTIRTDPSRDAVGERAPSDQVDQFPPKPSHDVTQAEVDQVDQAQRARTMEGEILGTPAYMPPEQAMGDVGGIDARSDVFSLGGILYSILTHEAPYGGETVYEVLAKAQAGAVVPPRKRSPWNRIPPELESICLKAMAPEKGDRYGSVEALVEDVRAYLDHRPVSAYRYGPVTRFVRFVQRHPAGSLAGGVALVLLSVGGALTGILWSAAQASAAKAGEQKAVAKAEGARAEAEALRAEKAKRDKTVAVERADTAEALLEKGRKVSAVLRAAHVELGEAHRALHQAFHSSKPEEEKRELADRIWPKVEAFEKTVPPDSASRAAWLASKGWLRRLAGFEEEALALFGASRKADRDVAYGFLFEGMVWLSRYLVGQPLPQISEHRTGIVFREMPPETAPMKEARDNFERLLEATRSVAVWGESSAREFQEVLDGFRKMQEGNVEAAERGLTLALSVPELLWLQDEILLARIKVRYFRKAFEDGLADVEKLLRRRPLDATSHFYRGLFADARATAMGIRGEDPREVLRDSIAAYTEALRLDPGLNGGYNNRGNAYLDLARFEKKRGEDPREPFEKAIADFSEAVRLSPGFLPARINTGNAWSALARWKQSRGEDPMEAFRKALENYTLVQKNAPRDLNALTNRASVLLDFAKFLRGKGRDPAKSFARALEDLTLALEIDPAHLPSLRRRANLRLDLGRWYLATGRDPSVVYAGALEDANEVLRREPDFVEGLQTRGKVHCALGRLRARKGGDPRPDFDLALRDFDASGKLKPMDPVANLETGSVHFHRGEYLNRIGEDSRPAYRKAVAAYSTSLKANPEAGPALINRAGAHKRLGEASMRFGADPGPDLERAALDLQRALEINPTDQAAILALGSLELTRGDLRRGGGSDGRPHFREAIRHFEKARRANPKDPNILSYLGNAYYSLGTAEAEKGTHAGASLRKAIAFFSSAAEINPGDAGILSNLGTANLHLGMILAKTGGEPRPLFEKAAEAFEASRKINPGTWRVYLHLGYLLERLGRLDEALASYDAVPGIVKNMTPQLKALLEISRGSVLTAIVRRDLQKADEDLRAGRFGEARLLFEKTLGRAAELGLYDDPLSRPTLSASHFNLAAVYALASAGKTAEGVPEQPPPPENASRLRKTALRHLRRAFELGWKDLDYVLTNPAFEPLRGDPAFQALLKDWKGKAGEAEKEK